jgi:hypothetical protein
MSHGIDPTDRSHKKRPQFERDRQTSVHRSQRELRTKDCESTDGGSLMESLWTNKSDTLHADFGSLGCVTVQFI